MTNTNSTSSLQEVGLLEQKEQNHFHLSLKQSVSQIVDAGYYLSGLGLGYWPRIDESLLGILNTIRTSDAIE